MSWSSGKALLALLCLAATSTGGLARGCNDSRPETVAAQLYLKHRDFIRNPPRSLLSRDLLQALAAEKARQTKEGDTAATDLWDGAREGRPGEKVLITDTVIEGRRASTRLSYSFSPDGAEPTTRLYAELRLVRESSGCWMVEDVLREGVSLQARLARAGERLRMER